MRRKVTIMGHGKQRLGNAQLLSSVIYGSQNMYSCRPNYYLKLKITPGLKNARIQASLFFRGVFIFPFVFCCQFSCSQNPATIEKNEKRSIASSERIAKFYNQNKGDSLASKSLGVAGGGSLMHGKLVPFWGKNYQYFDTWSYFARRAFLNDKVLKCALQAYDSLNTAAPHRKFQIMECSNEKGGKIHPHRTHQNGLSIDFMMPLLKNGLPFYGLDSAGKEHYLLQFNDNGKFETDSSISTDLDLAALHILLLQHFAEKNGLRISKVIIKTEFLPRLFLTKHGKVLKTKGIRFAAVLPPLINSLHDDHYHVDFEIIK